jgi:D-beta-D-heptose 7-phosphate kinase/D-beta-D-heptose 1-phosphate adenosyltransferase
MLVLGDIMLDRYTWGHADRVSPEAPVLVMRAERVNHEARSTQ